MSHQARDPGSVRRTFAGVTRALALGMALLAGAGVACAGPQITEAATPASPPMAVAARIERTTAGARLSFDLSATLTATAIVLENPDRIIIDLPQVNFQIDPAVGHARGESGALIKSFRFGLFAPGRSRIVIDLAGPAALVGVATVPVAKGDPSRLTIDIARTDRASFHMAAMAAAGSQPALPGPAASSPALTGASPGPASDAPRPVIVLDPGHGGIDPGASGLGGVAEKDVVFAFATLLAGKLRATGRYTVIMTRDDDTFVSLGNRVRIARDASAALFVSIHADTLPMAGSVTGATVYTASDRASDAEAARVAKSENEADSAAGVETAPMPSGVNDILFDLTRRETRTYAHLFQRTLVGYWQKIARLNKNPERAAGFRVLQAPDVPSVLLELGYLSSDKDLKVLTSDDWRDHATGSIVSAIDTFFAPRQSADGGVVRAASAPSAAADPHPGTTVSRAN